MKITKNGEPGTYIFLPAAAYVEKYWYNQVGSFGYYWSGTAYSSKSAYYLNFTTINVNVQYYGERYKGVSVRPVRLVAAVNP